MTRAASQNTEQARDRAPRGPSGRTVGSLFAFLFPFIAALTQLRGDALWRSDQAVLAALGEDAGFQGAVSSAFAKFALAFPLGSHGFRLAIPGAVFAGLAGLCVLSLCYTLFRKQGGHSRLDPWLGSGAAIAACGSLPWLSEATVVGGAAVGGALALILLNSLVSERRAPGLGQTAWLGVLSGALLSESAWSAGTVGAAALFIGGSQHPSLRDLRPTRSGMLTCAVFSSALAATATGFLGPALLSQTSSFVATWAKTAANEGSSWPLWSLLDWITSVGFLWCLGALAALALSLKERRFLIPFAIIIAADAISPGDSRSGWVSALHVDSNRLALHLTALSCVPILGALGLRTLGETAQALRLFAAKPIAAMVCVLAVAGCLASAEDSIRTLEQTNLDGAQTYTDEALFDMPERALVLTRSRSVGGRLLAAQALGERPDIVVVPLSQVTRPETLRTWLKREPALGILLRDLSVTDSPSERAITHLVDTRPVLLEADPTWDKRLLEHVLPTLPLATFSPHALGRSDRLAALESVPKRIAHIRDRAARGLFKDTATAQVLQQNFAATEETLRTIGDSGSLEKLRELDPKRTTPSVAAPKLAPVAAL